jgi:hypothetical protein
MSVLLTILVCTIGVVGGIYTCNILCHIDGNRVMQNREHTSAAAAIDNHIVEEASPV